jgi:hypothetical protein
MLIRHHLALVLLPVLLAACPKPEPPPVPTAVPASQDTPSCWRPAVVKMRDDRPAVHGLVNTCVSDVAK